MRNMCLELSLLIDRKLEVRDMHIYMIIIYRVHADRGCMRVCVNQP